jgi:hypothetical protein
MEYGVGMWQSWWCFSVNDNIIFIDELNIDAKEQEERKKRNNMWYSMVCDGGEYVDGALAIVSGSW